MKPIPSGEDQVRVFEASDFHSQKGGDISQMQSKSSGGVYFGLGKERKKYGESILAKGGRPAGLKKEKTGAGIESFMGVNHYKCSQKKEKRGGYEPL